MRGRFSDENLAATATLTGGDWAAALPLTNLQDETRFLSAPARQPDPADLEAATFDAALVTPRTINLVGVLFHTLSKDAQYRLTAVDEGGDLDEPDYDTGWTPVWGRMFPSENLPWEEPNWWLGDPRPEDLLLYPRHLWILIDPAVRVSQLRLAFGDAGADYFDLGGLWICGAWSPAFNFEHGRQVDMEDRSLSDESPSGRTYHEERTKRRRLTLDWRMLDRNEAWRLFDAGARRGKTRPVIFLPEPEDAVSRIREAFPATFEQPPAPRLGRPQTHEISAVLREIIA